jgi:hypothetical protein
MKDAVRLGTGLYWVASFTLHELVHLSRRRSRKHGGVQPLGPMEVTRSSTQGAADAKTLSMAQVSQIAFLVARYKPFRSSLEPCFVPLFSIATVLPFWGLRILDRDRGRCPISVIRREIPVATSLASPVRGRRSGGSRPSSAAFKASRTRSPLATADAVLPRRFLWRTVLTTSAVSCSEE